MNVRAVFLDSGERDCRGSVLAGERAIADFVGRLDGEWGSCFSVYVSGRASHEEVGAALKAICAGLRERGLRGGIEFNVDYRTRIEEDAA